MELYHYGIKGQKWGTRRWQNLDGSLTSAGRIRYGRGGKGRSTGSIYNPYTSSNAHSVNYGKIVDVASNYADNYTPKGYTGRRRSDSIQTKTQDMYRRQYEQSGQKGREYSIGNYLSTDKRRAANDLMISAVTTGKINQIKRPSDSNKNGDTSGLTKQNGNPSKNEQERTRYITERAETLAAAEQWAKQSLLSLARREGYDVANVDPDSLIKHHGTNSYINFVQSVNNMIERMGLGDATIRGFTILDSMGIRNEDKRLYRG